MESPCDIPKQANYSLMKRRKTLGIPSLQKTSVAVDELHPKFLHLLSEEESSEEQLKALHHCLEKLPEEQRTSITRFFLEEMSYADIVEQTGFTLNNVKSYIQNGKRNLKICIKKQAL